MVLYLIYVIVAAYNIQIALPHKVELSPLLAEAFVDGNVTLTCSFDSGSVHTETTYWRRNSAAVGLITKKSGSCVGYKSLEDTTKYAWNCPGIRNHSLTLKNVQRDQHADTWTCIVQYNLTKPEVKSNTSSIYIKVPVETVTLQAETNQTLVSIAENTSVVLSCKTSYSRPSPNVYWYLNNGKNNRKDDLQITSNIYPDETIKNDNYSTNGSVYSIRSSLTYKAMRKVDSWSIYCLASNVEGQNRSSGVVRLNVTYPPDQLVILGNISDTYKVIENQIANISCAALGGNPPAIISLNCTISAATTAEDNECLRRDIIWNVTREHNNKSCTCNALQTGWKKNTSVILEVLYQPNIPTIRWSYTHENSTFSKRFLKVIENVSIKGSCEASGNPAPSFIWLYQTSVNRKLDIQNISRNQKGVYICRALNEMRPSKGRTVNGSKEKAVYIDVLYAPEVRTVRNLSVIERGSIVVVCNTTFGNPNATSFEWTSDKIKGPLSVMQHMKLTDVSRDQAGFFKCRANNTMKPTNAHEVVGNSSSSLYLSVLYPPNIPSITLRYNTSSTVYKVSQVVNLIENSTFTLTCNASGEPTPVSYSWTAKFPSQHNRDAELPMNVVRRNQAGKYSCFAKNIMIESSGTSLEGTNSSSILINILYPPMIAQLHNETVLEGKPFKKTCLMKDLGMPEASNFFWTRDEGDRNWTMNILHINNVSRTDSMRYTCSAYNKMSSTFGNQTLKGQSNRQFHLDVVYSALIKDFFFFANGDRMILTVNETQTFQIACIVESNPAPNVSVTFPNGHEQSENGKHNLSVIRIATCLHAGTYTCTGLNMYNQNRGDFREQNLFVRCPPRPSDNMIPNRTIVTSARHDTASLSFNAYPFYDPNPTVFSWKKMIDSEWRNLSLNENIQVSTSDSQSNLTVVRVTESDYGEYLLIYRNSAGTSNYTFVMKTASVGTEPTKSSNSSTAVIVIVIGILIGVVAVLVVGVYFYRKRRSDTEKSKLIYQNVPFNGKKSRANLNTKHVHIEETSFDDLQEIDDVPQVTNEPTEYCNSPDSIAKIDRIKVSELFSYVLGKADDSFGADYHKLPTQLQMACIFARKPENIALNRYNGIYPYDHSRVMLNDDPDFFINACYIDGYRKSKAYIASLGPTEKTTSGFKTFWKMVWYERSDIIVMLTNLREPSGMKCEQYWPGKGADACYGDISVSAQTTEVFAEYTVRTFILSKNEEHRSLTQLHYTAWPDKKVPEDTTSLVVFRKKMKATPTSLDGPIIVHCSAGIGRTGTLIGLDRLIEEGQNEGSVNVYECVKSMREQRVKMVQTLEQYIYIYKALVNALTYDCEEIPVETFPEYVDTTSNNIYSRQFQQLRQSVETDREEELAARSANAKLTNKNRRGADVPGTLSRVLLYLNRQSDESEYINAVYLNSFKKRDNFIAAQSPLPCTTSDFICMIYQENCSSIVAMEDLEEPGMAVGKYLPDDGRSLTSGHFTVSCSRLETKQQYIVRKMNIKLNGKFDSGEKVVYHFQYTKWLRGNGTPGNAREFMEFVHDVGEYANQLGDDRSHVLVYCLKANQRSGLFCALSILMENIEAERQVSVLNTLRHLRTRRQTAITSMEQLRFCYEAVSAYIKMYLH